MKKIFLSILFIFGLASLPSCSSPPPEPKTNSYPAKSAPSKQTPPSENPTNTPEDLYENPNSPNSPDNPTKY